METVEPTAGLEEPTAGGAVSPTGELELVVAAGTVAAGVVVALTRVVETEMTDEETTVLRAGQSVTVAAQEVTVSYSVL